jgi:hypothetical protein
VARLYVCLCACVLDRVHIPEVVWGAAAALNRQTHGWFAVLPSESIILTVHGAGALAVCFAETDEMHRYLDTVG